MIEKIKVTTGVYWVSIQEAKLYVLCGCPADIVKHLIKNGFIKTIEKEGISVETGPNVILLSEVLIQHGQFSNLAEFPVLQMLYKQGLILPDHPNNTGEKPLLVGEEAQVHAQMQYIYRGNYGLTSVEEIVQAGVPEERAEELMRMKLKFAFGQISKTENFLDTRIVDQNPVELKNEVFIRRSDFNIYEFQYKGESVEVDMNLVAGEEYEPPYDLGSYQIRLEYFSVIHLGEGDGWDTKRPCMSSILIFQGKIYLIDAGPNVLHSLMSLGIGVHEIEGIFHTHIHDDHFAGLTTLMRADHRIKYYATSLVRASADKKLSSMMSLSENELESYFEIHNLEYDTWNNINGLEVKPILSPHPVENNIYIYRAVWEDGYHTYAHYADLASFDILKKMITTDSSSPGITQEFFDRVKTDYLLPANIKKIDIGGGLIHGEAEDFKEDTSGKIILAHTASKLTPQQISIGSRVSFGATEVLIPANQDYSMRYAAQMLLNYFPTANKEDLNMLLNSAVESHAPGAMLIKEGQVNKFIYLVLSGIIDVVKSWSNTHYVLTAGSLLGEFSGIIMGPSLETYHASSYVKVLKISSSLYQTFVKRNKLIHGIESSMDNREFLQNTWLFGEMISYPVLNRIARLMNRKSFSEGQQIDTSETAGLVLVKQGELELCVGGKTAETVVAGGFAGEDTILYDTKNIFEINVRKKSEIYQIPREAILEIPVVLWKLLETLERRSKIVGLSINKAKKRCHVTVLWNKSMNTGIHEIDEQHKKIINTLNSLLDGIMRKDAHCKIETILDFVDQYAKEHFNYEEELMEEYECPILETNKREHGEFIKHFGLLREKHEKEGASDTLASEIHSQLVDWLIDHIMRTDAMIKPYANEHK